MPVEIEITKGPRVQPERPPVRRTEDRSRAARRKRMGEPPPGGPDPLPVDRGSDRTTEPSPVGRDPGPVPDLSLRALPTEVQRRIAGPAPEVVLRARPRSPSVDELRAELERRDEAVANVRAGRADPLLYDYLRGARARFEDEARRLAEAIALGPKETLGGWGRGYLKGVEDAHRKDRADDDRPDLRTDADRRRPDLAAADEESLRQARSGAEERRVEVCLDVAPGRDAAATLRRGSGNAALDRVALEAFARSVAARPVPPDARTGRACYEVRISAFRAPPLPFVSCGLDRSGITCIWPFKKITSVTGRLLSVEYPPTGRAATAGSLLRRPR